MKKTNTPAAKIPALVGPSLTADVKKDITEWNEISSWLKKGKAREMELRKKLSGFFCATPREGTNNIEGAGYAVKIDHKVTRELDEAALDAVMPQLPENLRVIGALIEYRPKFKTDAYRALSADDRKIFEQALVIKEDGAPTLEIILREDAPAQVAAPAPAKVTKPGKPSAPAKPAVKKPTVKKPAPKPAKKKK